MPASQDQRTRVSRKPSTPWSAPSPTHDSVVLVVATVAGRDESLLLLLLLALAAAAMLTVGLAAAWGAAIAPGVRLVRPATIEIPDDGRLHELVLVVDFGSRVP